MVREAGFRAETIRLLNVPILPEARATLRVFDLDDEGDAAQVTIDIYTLDGVAVHRMILPLQPSGSPHRGSLAVAPSFLEIPLESIVPASVESVRIDLTPVTVGTRIWGYASITNNVTQHVTLVTPP